VLYRITAAHFKEWFAKWLKWLGGDGEQGVPALAQGETYSKEEVEDVERTVDCRVRFLYSLSGLEGALTVKNSNQFACPGKCTMVMGTFVELEPAAVATATAEGMFTGKFAAKYGWQMAPPPPPPPVEGHKPKKRKTRRGFEPETAPKGHTSCCPALRAPSPSCVPVPPTPPTAVAPFVQDKVPLFDLL